MIDEIANIWDEESLRDKMRLAYTVAANSTDRSGHMGALLVRVNESVCMGWNHFVKGFGEFPEHHERPMKYNLTEHAERDVIYKAAHMRIKTKGTTMVANWVACPDCARAIVLAGIHTVVCHRECMDRTPDRWREMVNLGLFMLKQGDVEVVQWSGTVGRIENLNNGKIWHP
jgi:dCMP deaminase